MVTSNDIYTKDDLTTDTDKVKDGSTIFDALVLERLIKTRMT